MEEQFFTRIVLTGGPCGGKTTALVEVSERLRTLGYQVFVQPEMATLLSNSGAGFPATSGPKHRHLWESERLRLQLAMEDCFERIARGSGRRTVLLCDRGAGDAAAYNEPDAWGEISSAAIPGSTPADAPAMMVNRYDLVIHLVSAAIGAEKFYDKAGNSARRESLEEAVGVDAKVMAAWRTHRRLCIVDNSTAFEGKIRRAMGAICTYLGIVAPAASRKLFLVRRAQFNPPDHAKVEQSSMTYTFLPGSTEDDNSCLRRKVTKAARVPLSKSTDGTPPPSHVVQMTYSHRSKGGVVTERSISGREYKALLAEGTDPLALPFTRVRRTFVHKDHLFELDDVPRREAAAGSGSGSGSVGTAAEELQQEEADAEEFAVLQVEVSDRNEWVDMPEWLESVVIRKVSPEQAAHYALYRTAVRLGQEKREAAAAATAAAGAASASASAPVPAAPAPAATAPAAAPLP